MFPFWTFQPPGLPLVHQVAKCTHFAHFFSKANPMSSNSSELLTYSQMYPLGTFQSHMTRFRVLENFVPEERWGIAVDGDDSRCVRILLWNTKATQGFGGSELHNSCGYGAVCGQLWTWDGGMSESGSFWLARDCISFEAQTAEDWALDSPCCCA